MTRKKEVLEFATAVREVDLERTRELWSEYSGSIVKGMSRREALEAYNLFDSHNMAGERNEFYDLITKRNHPAAQELIAKKYMGW